MGEEARERKVRRTNRQVKADGVTAGRKRVGGSRWPGLVS